MSALALIQDRVDAAVEQQRAELVKEAKAMLLAALLIRVKTDPCSLPRGIRALARAVVEAECHEEEE